MKFIINFLGWITLLIIVFFVVFSGIFSFSSIGDIAKNSVEKRPQIQSKPITKRKSFVDNQYFVACTQDKVFEINKALSAANLSVGFVESGKEDFKTIQSLLASFSCTMKRNSANVWPHLENSGYSSVGTRSVKDKSGDWFEVCEILDDKNRTLYVLGNCP